MHSHTFAPIFASGGAFDFSFYTLECALHKIANLWLNTVHYYQNEKYQSILAF